MFLMSLREADSSNNYSNNSKGADVSKGKGKLILSLR